MTDKKHLVWIILESAGPLVPGKLEYINEFMSALPMRFIEFSDMICAAPSSLMSDLGILTGAYPAMITSKHTHKSDTVDMASQSGGYADVPGVLKKAGYQVIGFHQMSSAPRSFPVFRDTHRGCPGLPPGHKGPWWSASQLIDRCVSLENELKDSHNALFFHLGHRGDWLRLPELFTRLAGIGMTENNTVVVLVGDHGWPLDHHRINACVQRITGHFHPCSGGDPVPYLNHDIHLSEQNVRVCGYLSYPGSIVCVKHGFTSALDLAPTVLELLGLNPTHELPDANGISLIRFLENSKLPASRVMRIDNRYVSQTRNRAVAMVSSQYRYVYRFGTSWKDYPFYRYDLEESSGLEELYDRQDIYEHHNLIASPDHQAILDEFREHLLKTEMAITARFEIPAPRNMFSGISKTPANPCFRDNDAVLRRSLRALMFNPRWQACNSVVLYGAGTHTSRLLGAGIVPESKIVAVIDDSPASEHIQNLRVYRPGDLSPDKFDAVLVSSDTYESRLLRQAVDIFGNTKQVFGLYRDFPMSAFRHMSAHVNCLPDQIQAEFDVLSRTLEIVNPVTALLVSWRDAEEQVKMLRNANCSFLSVVSPSDTTGSPVFKIFSREFPTGKEIREPCSLLPEYISACLDDLRPGPCNYDLIVLNMPTDTDMLGKWLTDMRTILAPFGHLLCCSDSAENFEPAWQKFSADGEFDMIELNSNVFIGMACWSRPRMGSRG